MSMTLDDGESLEMGLIADAGMAFRGGGARDASISGSN